MEISIPIQLTGLGLLVAFAGSFGFRWALLAAALVLLFLGFVLSGATIALQIPRRRPVAELAEQEAGEHVWTS